MISIYFYIIKKNHVEIIGRDEGQTKLIKKIKRKYIKGIGENQDRGKTGEESRGSLISYFTYYI